jgi:rfaE bifunctional protein kinase chain/domain
MKKEEILSLFEAFDRLKALVIGDVMIDAYYYGKVDRISPEAPVPVVHVTKSERRLGGAANVARNLKALGAKPILCSVIGEDIYANDFKQILDQEGLSNEGILTSPDRSTTVKTRIISGSQQMMRVDEESIEPLTPEDRTSFIQHIKSLVDNEAIDVILFEDYDKGVIDPTLIEAVVNIAHLNDIPVAVDPKKDNFLEYKNVDLFKPNLKEIREGLKTEINPKSVQDLIEANLTLNRELNNKNTLITLSEHGVFVSNESGSEVIPAHVRNIADVSGAGDTVISVASLLLALNVDNHILAQISNLAGGLVCEEVGVVPIDKQSLLDECLQLCNG